MSYNRKSNNKSDTSKSNKGFWEYSIFQKKVETNHEEQTIKRDLTPNNSLNLKHIDQYINPTPTREEQLLINFNAGKTLCSKDMIILERILIKNKEALKKDLDDITKLGIKAIVKTDEGKIHYMMFLLENFIKKSQEENIANLYLKLKNPKYTESLDNITSSNEKYKKLISQMNDIVNGLDLIDLQFTKFSNQMPPLNEKGFNKFDDWQIETINNINNNYSTIISAPTSAGKSVLSGYAATKGRVLYIVPTDALAWQVSSYIGNITNNDIPIITLTYQSIPRRDELISLLNISSAIVGTPELILDYLPFIKLNFNWVIFDEIHMIGKKEGSAMEMIAKILYNIPFLALSATIGNLDELTEWFKSLNPMNAHMVKNISCTKRFFNLQNYYYDNNQIVMINPLSLVTIDEFINKSIVTKTMNPTPQDTWSLVTQLIMHNVDLGKLNPNIFFNKNEIIELTKTYQYFNSLIQFMVDNFDEYNKEISDVINNYTSINFENYDTPLIDVLDTLNINDKFPAIIFQHNTISCLEIVRNLAEELEVAEATRYPQLLKERMNKNKNDKRFNKKLDKELSKLTEKQVDKKIKDTKDFVFELRDEENIYAPHSDFIYNKNDKFSDIDIKDWADKYKQYFPCMNGDYHFLIRLLWRGIGVYTNGLPDSYLRLIQSLAFKKKLAVVFSDNSLVFGISMPFRTAVIYRNTSIVDNLDPMLYHQMAGRAGRRGLDKEGNIVFIGYSWNRIKELSISSIPNVCGSGKLIWSTPNKISDISQYNYLRLNTNMLKPINTLEFLSNHNTNLDSKYKSIWEFCNNDDKNIAQMMWLFRYSNEGVIMYFLQSYLKQYFECCNPNDESSQIELAYFLSKFINVKEANNMEDVLIQSSSKIKYETIYDELRNIDIDILNFIDGRIWLSIRNNCLIDIKDDILRQELFDFSTKVKILQHYCFHTNQISLTKLIGKLLTRIWWIYHTSSPVIRINKEQSFSNLLEINNE